jgi:hypothetical protein
MGSFVTRLIYSTFAGLGLAVLFEQGCSDVATLKGTFQEFEKPFPFSYG